MPHSSPPFSSQQLFTALRKQLRISSSVWNGCAITGLFLEGYYPHSSASPSRPPWSRWGGGGESQWSGLWSQSIKPQAGEMALTLQALQITTLSLLNATAISGETGCIFHHRRGARSLARLCSPGTFLGMVGHGALSRNCFTAVGRSFH